MFSLWRVYEYHKMSNFPYFMLMHLLIDIERRLQGEVWRLLYIILKWLLVIYVYLIKLFCCIYALLFHCSLQTKKEEESSVVEVQPASCFILFAGVFDKPKTCASLFSLKSILFYRTHFKLYCFTSILLLIWLFLDPCHCGIFIFKYRTTLAEISQAEFTLFVWKKTCVWRHY